jgi:competence protein ComEA
VYTLPGGSRVADAVEAAGGARRRAVLAGVNLARVITDGEQIVVPTAGNGTTPARGTAVLPGGPTPASGGGTMSLNQATLADLETLPGIGPVLAQRILDHRDAMGGFTSVDDLRDVSGIGDPMIAPLHYVRSSATLPLLMPLGPPTPSRRLPRA